MTRKRNIFFSCLFLLIIFTLLSGCLDSGTVTGSFVESCNAKCVNNCQEDPDCLDECFEQCRPERKEGGLGGVTSASIDVNEQES